MMNKNPHITAYRVAVNLNEKGKGAEAIELLRKLYAEKRRQMDELVKKLKLKRAVVDNFGVSVSPGYDCTQMDPNTSFIMCGHVVYTLRSEDDAYKLMAALVSELKMAATVSTDGHVKRED